MSEREQAATIEVLSGFDILIGLLPEGVAPPPEPASLPVPLVPVGGGDRDEE